MAPQTGARQAWKLIQKVSGCPQGEAKKLAEDWVMNGVTQMETVNGNSKKTALRVVGSVG